MTVLTSSPPAGSVVGLQRPRLRSVPACAFRGGELYSPAGDEAVELADRAGLYLDPWQQHDLRDGMAERADGKWASYEACEVCSRQNGKGGIITARELWGLFVGYEERQVHSAHEFKTAAEGFVRTLSYIESTPDLDAKVLTVSRAHGSEGIMLKPRSTIIYGADGRSVRRSVKPELRFFARTSGSGRGFDGDTLYFDEAYNVADAMIQALTPILATKSNPQIWYLSSPVNKQNPGHSNGRVLSRLRRRALAGEPDDLCYLEHSADEDRYRTPKGVIDLAAMGADPEARAEGNPALGIRITMEFLGRQFRSMGPAGFAVEHLGVGDWYTAEDDEAAEADELAELREAWPLRADPPDEDTGHPGSVVLDPVAFALEVTPKRVACISLVGRRADGLRHVEVVERRAGTGWAPKRLVELRDTWGPCVIVIDSRGPAASMLPALQEAGLTLRSKDRPDGDIVMTTTAEYAQACGAFLDDVLEDGLRHLDEDALNEAVAGAKKRSLGDGFAWERRDPEQDISPLVSGTLAHWGHAQHAAAPEVEAWAFFDD